MIRPQRQKNMQSGRRRQGGQNDWAADLRVGLDLRARKFNTTIK